MGATEEEFRIKAARRLSEYYIGNPRWASDIIWAYKNPEAAMNMLDREEEK